MLDKDVRTYQTGRWGSKGRARPEERLSHQRRPRSRGHSTDVKVMEIWRHRLVVRWSNPYRDGAAGAYVVLGTIACSTIREQVVGTAEMIYIGSKAWDLGRRNLALEPHQHCKTGRWLVLALRIPCCPLDSWRRLHMPSASELD